MMELIDGRFGEKTPYIERFAMKNRRLSFAKLRRCGWWGGEEEFVG
jgi:hypothetical protein